MFGSFRELVGFLSLLFEYLGTGRRFWISTRLGIVMGYSFGKLANI